MDGSDAVGELQGAVNLLEVVSADNGMYLEWLHLGTSDCDSKPSRVGEVYIAP